jgi:hypothetical protein
MCDTKFTMLSLPKPYGYPDGTPIRIKWIGEGYPTKQQADYAAGVVFSFGCPPFIIPKVASSLLASGEYECRVTIHGDTIRNFASILPHLGFSVSLKKEPMTKRDKIESDYR